ncbi:MAG: response regulator transcription factor [Micrococcales bacterium]|nr:response regulator transcription factor [Micrococcales bacterium]
MTGAEASGRPTRVVVVDDHPDVLRAVVELLATSGMVVEATVSTVAEGYSAVLRTRPDVAVVNRSLPNGEGLELCRRLHADAPEVVLVVHSAERGEDRVTRAREAGAAEYVVKTASGRNLVAAIRRHSPER